MEYRIIIIGLVFFLVLLIPICIVSIAVGMGSVQRNLRRIVERLDVMLDNGLVRCYSCGEDFPVQQLNELDSGEKLCCKCLTQMKGSY